jgi:hypothetical protein
LEPLIVTAVPPPIGPEEGEILVTMGAVVWEKAAPTLTIITMIVLSLTTCSRVNRIQLLLLD